MSFYIVVTKDFCYLQATRQKTKLFYVDDNPGAKDLLQVWYRVWYFENKPRKAQKSKHNFVTYSYEML